MKCRLYPSKKLAEHIDKAILAVQSFHNCTLYEIFNNNNLTKEVTDKKDGNKKVHFVDKKKITSAEWKNSLSEKFPIQNSAPASSLVSNVYGVVVDIIKSLGNTPIEFQKPQYYSKKKPRDSFSYQECLGKLEKSDNKNVLYIKILILIIKILKGTIYHSFYFILN